MFLTFSYPSHLKHLLLRAFLEDCLPERLSKVGVLAERGMKKSKKTLHRSEVRAFFAVETYIYIYIYCKSLEATVKLRTGLTVQTGAL